MPDELQRPVVRTKRLNILAAALAAAFFVPETGTPMYHEFARCVWQLEADDNDGFFWCYARYLDSLDDYNRWKERQ